jgi:hypothetical protein
MVNEAILGALKSGLARNESLKKAMMAVYNAGYKKEEISEAARLINEGGSLVQTVPGQKTEAISEAARSMSKVNSKSGKKRAKLKKIKEPIESATTQMLAPPNTLLPKSQQFKQPTKKILKSKVISQKVQPPQNKNTQQKVSGYGQQAKPKSKTPIILLGFLLLFLIGSLVTLFLFKEELLSFFNSLFN